MNSKILFVDDDPNLLDGIQRALRRQFQIVTALGGDDGLRKLESDGPFAVVVADMQMPAMSGLEFLRKVQTAAPDAIRMMLTGNADQKTAMDAVNDGRVFRFLTKPCPAPVLTPAVESALEQFRLMSAEKELLEKTLGGAVKVLTEILSLTDPASFDRSQKLKDYVHEFLPSSSVSVSWELELAAMLAPIGRVTVPPQVLSHAAQGVPLTGPERDILNRVPEFGAHLLENIPRLENVANIVRYQHKNFDGTGFPHDAVAGEEIPIGSRILKVLSDLIEYESSAISRPSAFQRMQERVGCYDLTVLAAASRWCDVALRELSGGRTAAPQALRIDDLRIGHILAEDLRTPDGLLLVAANTKLSSMLLVKLLNFRTLNTIDNTLLVHVD